MNLRVPSAPALIALTALSLLLGGCGTGADDDQSPSSSEQKTRKPGKGHSASEPAAPTSSSAGEPAGKTTVPAYFVGETPQGPRLYREFRTVEADNPAEETLALLLAGDVLDPDYRTFLPSGDVPSVAHDDGLIVVELPDDSWRARSPEMDAYRAALAVQQVVYTLQGIEQSRDPVEFRYDGRAGPVFGIDSTGGIENSPPLETLALVSVTTPEYAQKVSGSFIASGVASSFEATVPWQILQDGRVVDSGFAMADGWMDKLYPWETEVDVSGLEAGVYEFVARTDDPSEGEGGGPHEDTKTIIVQ